MVERKGISRRDFFKRLIPGWDLDEQDEIPDDVYGENVVAVIQGRYCHAYLDVPCTKCVDHCPVSGAIELQDDLPMVVAEICTGCGVCTEICPSSADAILMVKADK